MRVVVLLLLVSLAGCLDGDDARPAENPDRKSITQERAAAPPGHLATIDDMIGNPDVFSFPDNQTIEMSVLPWLAQDVSIIVLVKALEDGELDVKEAREISWESDPGLGGDTRPSGDNCLHQTDYYPAPGDDMLDMLDGMPPGNTTWKTQRASSSQMSTGGGLPLVASGGTMGGSGSRQLSMDAGTWYLMAWSISGLEPSQFTAQGNSWHVSMQADMPFEVVVLPRQPFLCGLGVDRWDDVLMATPSYAVGGHIDGPRDLGSAFALRDVSDDLVPSLTNDLTITFGDETIAYDGQPLARTSLAPVDVRFDNERWEGTLVWRLMGFWDPFGDEAPVTVWQDGRLVQTWTR